MTQQLSAAERKQTLIGLLIGAVLAVPFAAAGLGILLFMTAPMVYDWARMQTWHSVPAQVEAATLQSQKSSKGSTSYSVSSRPCKIHPTAQANLFTAFFLAPFAAASAVASIQSCANKGVKKPFRPRRTMALSSQQML